MVEGTWPRAVTSVEEGAMVLEVMVAQIIMDDIKVDIADLEVMVATMADVVLVIVVEGVMNQVVQTKAKVTMAVVKDTMVMMKEKILAVVTMVVVGTIMVLEIIVDNSN